LTPVPLKPTTAVPLLVESLVTVNWPASAPEAAGLNVTLTVYFPPAAARVTGRLLWPLTEKDLPEILRLEISTGEAPRFTRETVAVAVLPRDIEPKLTLPGDTWSIPEVDPLRTAPPQPESAIASQGMIASNRTERHPQVDNLPERTRAQL
jgi:hypothetical protein